MKRSLCLLLFLVGCTGPAGFDKPEGHELRRIHGWIVAVDYRLLDDETGTRALALLEKELRFISEKVPGRYAKKLRAIPIWVDKYHGALKGETYHPDLPWLVDHGYDTSLWRCVQIARASDFCDPARRRIEPNPMLHQLIHGYQSRAFTFKDPRIVAGWERFRARHAESRVMLPSGELGPHPALIRPREYFLEMSLAFFNIGRVPPKTAEELKRNDGETFNLIEECWQRKE